MEALLTPVDRYDALDMEALNAVLESPIWVDFECRIQKLLDRATGDCTRADSELDVRRAQGEVKAYRAVLETPKRMREDMRNPRKVANNRM